MRYEEQAASPDLAPYIERLWHFAVEEGDPGSFEHVIPPDGTVNLSVIAPGPGGGTFIGVSGPSVVAFRTTVHRHACYFGLRLQPGAFRPLFGREVGALVDNRVLLESLAPRLATALAHARRNSFADFACDAETALRDFAAPLPARDEAVCELVERLVSSEGSGALDELMAGLPVGARQLRRRFVREVGLTPKAFARIRRLRRACIEMVLDGTAAAVVSAGHGYADQSHFSRELRAMFQMSPQLLGQYLAQIAHVNLRERQ